MTGTWQTTNTYRFTNLIPDTIYYVIVKVQDTDGNETESQVYKVTTKQGETSGNVL